MVELRSKVSSVCPCLWQKTILYSSDQVAYWLLAQQWKRQACGWESTVHSPPDAFCFKNARHDWSYKCTTAVQWCCLAFTMYT